MNYKRAARTRDEESLGDKERINKSASRDVKERGTALMRVQSSINYSVRV